RELLPHRPLALLVPERSHAEDARVVAGVDGRVRQALLVARDRGAARAPSGEELRTADDVAVLVLDPDAVAVDLGFPVRLVGPAGGAARVVRRDLRQVDPQRTDPLLVDAAAVALLGDVAGRRLERPQEIRLRRFPEELLGELDDARRVVEDLRGLDPGELGEEPAAAR